MKKFDYPAMKSLFHTLFKDINFKDVEGNVDKTAYLNAIVRIGVEQKKLDIEFINRELKEKSLKNYEMFKRSKKRVKREMKKKSLDDYID